MVVVTKSEQAVGSIQLTPACVSTLGGRRCPFHTIYPQISSAPDTAQGDPFGNFCILTRLAGVGNAPFLCFETRGLRLLLLLMDFGRFLPGRTGRTMTLLLAAIYTRTHTRVLFRIAQALGTSRTCSTSQGTVPFGKNLMLNPCRFAYCNHVGLNVSSVMLLSCKPPSNRSCSLSKPLPMSLIALALPFFIAISLSLNSGVREQTKHPVLENTMWV